jgi:hypothetical protein
MNALYERKTNHLCSKRISSKVYVLISDKRSQGGMDLRSWRISNNMISILPSFILIGRSLNYVQPYEPIYVK